MPAGSPSSELPSSPPTVGSGDVEKPTGDVIMAISLDMEKNMQIFNWDVFWMYINIMAYHIISWDYFWDVFIVVL